MQTRCRNCGALADVPDFHGPMLVKCGTCEWQEVLPARRRLPKELEGKAGAAYAAHRDHERTAAATLEHLRTLSPRDFETFCAELLEDAGYVVARAPAAAADTHALELRRGDELTLAACRNGSVAHRVDREEVENLAGAMRHDHAVRGVFVTTGGFTDAGRAVAEKHGIELVDADALRERLESMETARLERWSGHGAAADGDAGGP